MTRTHINGVTKSNVSSKEPRSSEELQLVMKKAGDNLYNAFALSFHFYYIAKLASTRPRNYKPSK